jgi:four helix bundle protein
MSNTTEGFDRRTRTEFRQFLSIAKGSASEVRCQMYAAEDVGYVTK